jgi:hypothetical protein
MFLFEGPKIAFGIIVIVLKKNNIDLEVLGENFVQIIRSNES